jgi:peptide/nickel transport system ATP-binding protein
LRCLVNQFKVPPIIKKPILHISNLSLSFGQGKERIQVLKGVDLQIFKGEVLALVGESGSGKSVTSLMAMQLITNGLENMDSGEIWYAHAEDTIALHELTESQMQTFRAKELAMIFQEPMTALNPSMTCGAQVCEVIQQHLNLSKSENRARCINLFDAVELPEPDRIYNSYPHQLSGGQKQRVMIAMALSCNPKVLIADEPTTALDVTVQKEVLGLIKSLQQKHQMGCLFISHDLELVREVADHIAVMQNGVIVECKPANELFAKPTHPYTKALLACRPAMHKNLKTLATVSDVLENPSFNIKDFYAQNELSIKQVDDKHQELYTKTPILELDALRKVYPGSGLFRKSNDIVALNKVTMSLYKGESLGIVGESGSGKSTLGKCIIQLENQSSGSIKFYGDSVKKLLELDALAYRKAIQMVFQDPATALNPRLKVGVALVEVMRVHSIGISNKERKQKAKELLSNVGLKPAYFHRFPHELSGGQKQRIGIARALALEPKIIICDESVSALDVSVQAQILNLLNELKETYSLSYLFISHDLGIVKHFCDRVIVLNQGEIEESILAQDLLTNSKSAYTKRLINSLPGITSFP